MYIDVQNIGNKILVRDTEGDYVVENFQPKIYFPSAHKTDMFPVSGNSYLTPIIYDDIKTFKETLYSYKNRGSKVYGDKSVIAQFMNDRYKPECITDYNKIKIFNIDIEADVAKGTSFPELMKQKDSVINAITISYNDNLYVWGLPLNGETFTHNQENLFYNQFDSEYKLLKHFIDFWDEHKPHIVTGWNIDTFDIPYLYDRITKVVGEAYANKMSPYRIVKSKSIKNKQTGQESPTYDLLGVARLDYLTLYKKWIFEPRENYKLDTIAEVELGEKKLSYEESGSLRQLYRDNYQKFIDYNIKDVVLVDDIDKKRNLLRLAVVIANFAKVNYQEVLSPIMTWKSAIFHDLMSRNEVPEIKFTMAEKDRDYDGGFVFPPIPGLHKWVMAFDLDSLYPSVIRQWNIGPETLADPFDLPEEIQKLYCNIDQEKLRNQEYDLSLLKEHNLTICPSGYLFKTDKQSFFSILMEDLFTRRIKEKKLMKLAKSEGRKEDELLHNTFQMAMKVLLNSAYGAMASKYFPYFDLRLAESITLSGQLSIKSTIEYLDERLKEHNNDKSLLIAGDTDSIYLSVNHIVDKKCPNGTKEEKLDFCDKFSDKVLQVMINKNYEEVFDYLNCYSNNLNMTREVIADRAIWCKKKRYAMSVLDDEGYRPEEPKIKIMGLEIIKSSTPKYCANELKNIVKDILLGKDEQDVIKDIAKFRSTFEDMHITEIAANSSVNYITKYLEGDHHKKGAQAHIRAAINFNRVIKQLDIDLEPIYEGDKIKIVPLIEPNPIGDNVIGFKDALPEMAFKYIDYETIFDKVFTTPLKKVTDVIDWSLVPASESRGLF